MLTKLRHYVRRALRFSPGVYPWAKRWYGAAMFALRIPHDSVFAVFQNFTAKDALIADIGANSGQSVRSIRLFSETAAIISFEPNRLLEPDLKFTAGLVGRGFSYQLIGIGKEQATAALYVPNTCGLLHTPWATTDSEELELHREQIANDIGADFNVQSLPIQIVPFDELNLRPDAAKIDVEGLELDVLTGMAETLRACEPLLLLEHNAGTPAVCEFLANFGYVPYEYLADENAIADFTTIASEHTSFVAMTSGRMQSLIAAGMKLHATVSHKIAALTEQPC